MISTYLNPLNFLIFMLGLSIWFDVVVYSFPIAFLPILLQDSYSSVEIGTVMSILWWASLSTTFILIVVSHLYPMEKSKQKIYRQVKIIIACNIVQSCLHIWVAFNPTYVTFLLYRMFAGICSGFAWIYILAVAIDIEADEKYSYDVFFWYVRNRRNIRSSYGRFPLFVYWFVHFVYYHDDYRC